MQTMGVEELMRIPGIESAARVPLTAKIKERLGKELAKEAQRNSRHLFAYKIVYRSRGQRIAGFLVEPQAGSKCPCIIWNRGGSAHFGALVPGQLFTGGVAALARAGYIVIASQHAGGPDSEGVDEWGSDGDITDVLRLREFLKKYPKADASRVGMYGGSRGGMTAYRALAKIRWVKAAVVVAGVANLARNAQERPAMYKNVFKPLFGGSKKAMRERSAVRWADKFSKKTPVLLMHGTADWRVSPCDSIELAEQLYKHNVPYRLVLFEGAGHSLTEVSEEKVQQMLNWFDRFVKNNAPLPTLKKHGA